MKEYEILLECIQNNPYVWSDYTKSQLVKESTLKLLRDITIKTGKEPGEVIMLLLCIMRYISDKKNTLQFLEENDLFQDYIKEHYSQILELSSEKNVQANLPERGLPISDFLGKELKGKKITVIELGSSYGLIGHCLLNVESVIKNKELYFTEEQKIPEIPQSIDSYMGIEINPPDKEWVYACIDDYDHEMRLKNFLENRVESGATPDNFQIIKGSAFGFSELDEIKKIKEKGQIVIVLTSFMLYQFSPDKQALLKEEINNFLGEKGYWINQTVDINAITDDNKYYIEINSARKIKLFDDLCNNWTWI